MEIGAIPGIRVIPATKAPPVDPELTAFFEVESAAPAGDDTYTGSGRKAAGAEEDEEDAQDSEIAADAESAASPREENPGPTVSFFA